MVTISDKSPILQKQFIIFIIIIICKITDIQSFSSRLYKIIIDYLLIFAKVTSKQYPGAILISDSKMQSGSCESVKCEPNNFRNVSCDSGNLRVVSYNSTSL